MSEAAKTPPAATDAEKSDAAESKTPAESSSAEAPSGQRRSSPASAAGMPNPFDFSAMTGLLNDPSIKELAEQIAKDPAFNHMAEQLQKTFQGASVGDGVPNFDTQQYYSTMQQVMQNPQFMAMAERLGGALIQDPAMSGMLESLTNPANKEQLEERMSRIKSDPSLRPILEEIENGGPSAMMRYWNDKEPGDDEPLPALVIKEAGEESKQQMGAMMECGEEESHGDLYLKQLSDKELMEKIARAKISLGPGQMLSKLPDGGSKLRAVLRRQEAELERRRLLKDDYKCKKATPLAEESTCAGATDNLSHRGALLSGPASKSTSALRFCCSLNDISATKSFSKELSTSNSSDHKNIRETRKIDLSSRKVPLESPSHLLASTDDPRRDPSDRDASGCFTKKENFSLFQPNRNSRRTNKTVVLVDEQEFEVEVKNRADQVGRSSKDTRLYYPSRDDPKAIEICYTDMECLAPESYLSSNIMNFYIRFLQKPTSPTARKRCNYHFFSTYFYKKLKQDGLTKIDKETSYAKFRRWWKGVNIFQKAYIFLPIHEHLHWSLVIICIPNKEDESGPIILHLDSLGLHMSKSIFNNVKSFLVEEWKFLRQEEPLPELPFADNIWNKLSRRIDEKVLQVPQQKNDYDCGLFVLYFMERFIEEAPERLKKKDLKMFGRQWFKPEAASSLRGKISALLWNEFKNTNEGTCKLDPRPLP